MPLRPGIRLGQYEVLSALGAGGMGEVWRARDTRLDRDVALKVLPEAFTSDPERLARFEREAKVLASLNHSNVGGIHGVEEADGVKALVLELVEGPTLADRIAQGSIPLDEALPIALQIAEALEAAHERGIVHRDLKPANIKVRPDGTVKVLDFGLAKALEPQLARAANLSQSPTLSLSAAATQMGVVLGTAAYMAPEQARGRPVDKRADIWAFGCVLYEMLSGRQAFARETTSDTLAAILTNEPDWSALPATTPAPIADLLGRCLAKDPRARLRDIGDSRFEIRQAGLRTVEKALEEAGGARRRVLLAAVLLAGIAAGTVAVWIARDAESPPSGRTPIRFSIEMPSGVLVNEFGAAVSFDGRSIALTAAGAGERSRIWIRSLDGVEVRPVAGTEGAFAPFWSPDGGWIGFFTDGKMKRVRVAGGPAEPICDAPGTSGLGGTWNSDNVIVFSMNFTTGLHRVDAAGGTPSVLTTPQEARDEQAHLWPRFLPDGRRFAYTVTGAGEARRTAAVGSIEGMDPKVLFAADATPVFTGRGTVAFARGNTIFAQRIDSTTLDSMGDPVVLGGEVGPRVAGWSFQGAASTLTWYSEVRRTTLAWFDRAGGRLDTVASGVRLRHPALSPDGGRIAVERANDSGMDELWLFDGRGAGSLLAPGPGRASDVVWSPDGERLVFSRGDGRALVEIGPDGTERPLLKSGVERAAVYPTDWSSDGEHLLYAGYGSATFADVWMLQLSAPGKPVPLVRTDASEHQARFSPDGRFIAYASDESGRPEVYVRPMPPSAGKEPVSTQGGAQPMWRHDGRELFYVDLEGTLKSVSVEAGSAFEAGAPVSLFRLPLTGSPFVSVRNDYTVSRDGQRFLVASVDPSDGERLNVMVDWEAGLADRDRP